MIYIFNLDLPVIEIIGNSGGSYPSFSASQVLITYCLVTPKRWASLSRAFTIHRGSSRLIRFDSALRGRTESKSMYSEMSSPSSNFLSKFNLVTSAFVGVELEFHLQVEKGQGNVVITLDHNHKS